MNPKNKYRIKCVAGMLGLRTRSILPRRESVSQFCRHLVHAGFPLSPVIIDVGVADGTFEIYDEFPRATYLLIEPMEEFVPALQWISKNYDAHYVLAAAGVENGNSTIFFDDQMAQMHGASLFSASEAVNTRSRTISVRRLDSIVREKGLKGPFLLKIDTQGTELEVLAGAEGILQEVEVVILEASFFTFGKNRPLFNEVIRFMEDHGFYPYDFFGGFNRSFDGALGQIDVAFVKTNGQFRSDHRYSDPSAKVGLSTRVLRRIRRHMGV